MFGSRLSTAAARLAAGGLLLVLAGQALAFAPVPQNEEFEIPLASFPLHDFTSFAVEQGRAQAASALAARYGGNWHVYSWNPQTDTPHYAYGTPARVARSITDGAQVEQLARQVMAANADLFPVRGEDLALWKTPSGKGRWVAHFKQTHHGLEVWQGKALVAFSDAGDMILLGSDLYPDIALDPTPVVSEAEAVALARMGVPFNPATDTVLDGRDLMVLPVPLSETEVEHHLVWRVTVRTKDPLGKWVTHVDAHDGEIVWRYNDIHFAYGGDTNSETQPITYCDGAIFQAMPHLDVDVSGLGTATSDADGNWSIAGTGGNRTASCDLGGPYIHVYDNAQGSEAFFSATVQEDVPLTVDFAGLGARQDERDVFDGVNDIHDYMEQVDPGYPYWNQTMAGQVNLPQTCNAYWDGNIHFFNEGGGCANTGEIQGVVHHEFGHGVQWSHLGYQGEQGLGEGNSDILANIMTRESIIGRGFNLGNCDFGIRNSDNELVYPDDVIGVGIHAAGQVIAGFHWDAMEVLTDAFGEEPGWLMVADTWHFGRKLLAPTTQPDQVFATFFADDDNGNMDDGTPNYGAYCVGAVNHGFECPPLSVGVLFAHNELEDTDDTQNPYMVAVDVTSTYDDIDDATVTLSWRHDGSGWTDVAMTPSIGDTYTAQIPAQDVGLVEYYFSAEDLSGNAGVAPAGAPLATFDFNVAWLVDDGESAAGWTVGDPNDQATGGIWENVDPIGTIAQPEDDHSTIGTKCWITGQHTPGEADDFNDVDGGKTTLYSPVWDLSLATSAQVSFWYYWSDNLGGGGGDFMYLRASNDGGDSFTSIETVFDSPNEWREVVFTIDDLFNGAEPGELQLKFEAADLSTESLVEGAVDDLMILAEIEATNADDGFAIGFPTDLAQNHPNPFNPKTEIRFQLENRGHATLRVYDAAGRLVSELVNGSLDAGAHRVVWNGVDAGGSPVASGVYLYQLQTAGKTQSRRMVLIK